MTRVLLNWFIPVGLINSIDQALLNATHNFFLNLISILATVYI